MSDWREVKLEEISEMQYGKMPDKKRISETGYPIFSGYRIVGYYDEYMYQEPQLIVVARGVGGTGDVKISPPFAYITNLSIIVKLNEEISDKKFYYYYFQNMNLRYLDSGSAQSQITISDLKNLIIPLPELKEQKAIAAVLSALDDKIEINNQINQKLEEMAQTIFKSWFVDFEPFQDGEFEDSELGVIPKGWRVGKLGDILELAYGKALKSENRNLGSIPVYGSNGITGYHDEYLSKGPGVIVGRKGYPGSVNYSHFDFFVIDTAFYVIPTSEIISPYYFYCMLLNQKLDKQSVDSAVPGLNRNITYNNKVIIPPGTITEEFQKAVDPMLNVIALKNSENKTLINVRDGLLPKLTSGEIRVGEDL